MTIYDALKVLGINEQSVTEELVKGAYYKACKRYHPDLNPAGAEMMKLINEAKNALKNAQYPLESKEESDSYDYGAAINEALNKIIHIQNIKIEICGSWVWVSGDTKDHWPLFKEAGFRFSGPKKMVYFRPESQSKKYRKGSLSMEEIRAKYGASNIKNRSIKFLSEFLN